MNIEEILIPKHAQRLLSRIAQASLPAEKKMAELGVTLNRENPRETLYALVDAMNAVPAQDRYKIELLIIGDHCLRFWFAVFDAIRAKAPKDAVENVIEAVDAAVDVVEAVVDLVTPDEPAKEPTKETAAAVKAKGKK